MADRNAAPSSPSPTPVRVRFDRFELDEANARLLCEGRAIALAPTPFALLCALVRRAGSLLTKNALLDEVWGHQFVSESVLKTVISELRTVLKDDARHPRFIETVSRRGYRFMAPTIAATTVAFESTPQAGSPQAASFIGRTDALSRLHANWNLACSGKRRVAWVSGEPGIGKTALIERFVAGLGTIVSIRGQCVEQHGAGEPYLPVLEALSDLCRRDEGAAALLRAVAPTWLMQLPWLSTAEERAALRQELAGVSPERMLREMGEMLDRYTERTPLLLVSEDLHWSDRATIHLIDSIARRRGSARLMWLASYRLAEVVASDHPLNSLRHELRLHGLCEEIVLDPFSEAEVAEYLAQQSPSIARDEAVVRALHERTDGVPLFVASVASEVVARAAQRGDDGAAAQLARMAVPDNLAAIIDHYIAKLDNDQRSVLEAAAACGVEFRTGTISAALERDVALVGRTCDDLVHGQLWLAAPRAEEGRDAREPPYSFRHALFRQVLYERTAQASRSELHRRVGSALERERAEGLPVAAAELAVHFERGREPMKALSHYVKAAEAALDHFSPEECMTLTERGLGVLDFAPEGTDRNAIEVSLATLRGVSAFHVLGVGSSEAKSAFQRAYSLLPSVPEHPMRGRLLHGLGFVLSLRADYDDAIAVAERSEALASATNDPVLVVAAAIVHAEVDQLQGRSRAALVWMERGLAVAGTADSAPGETFAADPQVTLLGLFGVQLLLSGFVHQARAKLERARARADLLRQPMAKMVAIWFDAIMEVRLDNAERVAALADEMRTLVEEFALAQGRVAHRWFGGWAEARRGQPREAYRRIREAYQQNTQLGMLAGGSEVRGYAAEALVLAGDWPAAQRELEEALQFATTHRERVYLPQLFLTEAAIARGRGKPEVADASIRRAIAEARAQEAPWLELMALHNLAEYGDATADDLATLIKLVDGLPEASETTTVAKVRALLDKAKTA